ncbi:MAG: hypothetical protein AAF193_04270, partial [Bacteroidota bacterium]
ANLDVKYSFNQEVNSGLKSDIQFRLGYFKTNRQHENVLFFGSDVTTQDLFPSIEAFLPEMNFHVQLKEKRMLHDVNLNFRLFHDEEWSAPLTSLEYNGSFKYNRKGKQVKWRIFGGVSPIGDKTRLPLSLSGFNSGSDVFADYLYLDRSAHFREPSDSYFGDILSRQITDNQGGMFYAPVNGIGDWFTSARVEYQLPVGLPISLWASGGLYNDFSQVTRANYSAGVSLELIQDVFEIHLPLLGTDMFRNDNSQPWDFLTFELNLHLLSPQKMIRKIQF